MENKLKILKPFFEEPNRKFQIREVARILKKNHTTVRTLLNEFVKKKVLIINNEGIYKSFSADTESGTYKRLKLNYNLSLVYDSGFIEFLEKELNYFEAVVLFGSFAKAENEKNSDVDILIVGSSSKKIDLSKIEKKIGHKIQLFIHSDKEIQEMKNKNKELLNNMLNGIKLYGFWEVFR